MTEHNKIIRGAKKGGEPRTPIEHPDSLQSTQFARVMDVISEGEIDQIEGGAAGILLDGTPLSNFSNAEFVIRTGTQTQTYISGGDGIEATTSVNLPVTVAGGAVTRTITANTTDRVRVTIEIPTLQIITDEGDIIGHEVRFSIAVQYNGGGFNTVRTQTIKGKTSNAYTKSITIGISGSFPVDIRVTRISADETSAKRQNTIKWASFTTIIDEKLRYPNTALTFLELDARNFSNIPARKYLIRGIKVQIPHNATVDTTNYIGRITYSGLFNGTLGAATWTNDPAWILYDLLRNDRYGCGIDASHLDVFDFYAISQYCNELVSNGVDEAGEPRFALNIVLNTRKEVFTVIKELVNIFRGLAFFSSGSFVIKQDKPTDSTYVINPSNVVDGFFEYNGTSHKSRHTCVTVAYQSYDMLGEVQFERVEDADAVRVYGSITKEIKSLGCYSQSQAHRLGRWILETERYLTQTVSFSVSVDSGLILIPGMVVSIADPLKMTARRGGRVKTATTTFVTLDSKEDIGTFTTENSPKIMVVLPTGIAEERTISSIGTADNTTFTVTVSSAFSQAPAAGSFYAIETSTVKPEKYRIIKVTEEEEKVHTITAVQYDPDIYARIDTPIIAPPVLPPPVGGAPNAVTDISFSTFYYTSGSSILIGCDVSWVHDGLRTVQYFIDYRIDNDNFTEVISTSPNIELKGLRAGTLEVSITAFSFLGGRSVAYSETHTITSNPSPPENVSNFTVTQLNTTQAEAKWAVSSTRDVIVGGYVVIKHSTNTNDTFDTAASLHLAPGSTTSAIVPAITGKYYAKFENILGIRSAQAASVEFTQTISNRTLIYDQKEDTDTPTTFAGTYTNTEKYIEPNYASPLNGIVLKTDTLWDSVASVDALSNWDFVGNVLSTGEYIFNSTLDLEGTHELLLERRLAFTGFNVDTGAAVSDVDAEVYVRTTTDDPDSGSASFSSWKPFQNIIVKARGFQFKVVLTSLTEKSNICITQLGVRGLIGTISNFTFTPIDSGTAAFPGKTVSFTNNFFTGATDTINGTNAYKPAVSVTLQNNQSGDHFTISDIQKSSFKIFVKQSNGNAVDRQFTYQAIGLG